MNPISLLDHAIVTSLDAFARKSWAFDHLVSGIAENNLLKGGIIMAAIWWAWFHTDPRGMPSQRLHVLATIIGCLAALAIGRLLVVALPFRLRPIYDTASGFVVPYGVNTSVLAKASSFPSDHAVLFFALVTGLYMVSRAAGILAAVYTIVVIALPRLYLGLHYFSDIVAGAAIGASICWLANRILPRTRLVHAIEVQASARPSFFYAVLFLVTSQIAELFDSLRAIAGGLLKLLH